MTQKRLERMLLRRGQVAQKSELSHLHGFALWLEHTLAVRSWVRVRPAVTRMGVLPLLFRALRADPHRRSLSPELNHPSTPLSLP